MTKPKFTRTHYLVGAAVIVTLALVIIVITLGNRTANQPASNSGDSAQDTVTTTTTQTPTITTTASVTQTSKPSTSVTNQPTTSVTPATSKTLSGKTFHYTLAYPTDWTVKNQTTEVNNLETVIIKPNNANIEFNMSVANTDPLIAAPGDYDKVQSKNISINGKTYESALYQAADWSGSPASKKMVIIKVSTNPYFYIQSNFDSGAYSDGWNIINSIASSIKY